MENSKKYALDKIDESSSLFADVSDKIWEYAELSLKEYKSAALYLEVLKKLGVKRGMVIHGLDGLDEITLTDKTIVCEINGDNLTESELDPTDYGFTLCDKSELVGGDAQENAEIIKAILSGEKGAKRDIVTLNSGVVLYLAGKADSIKSGIALAAETIDSGKAIQQLKKLVKTTNSFNN